MYLSRYALRFICTKLGGRSSEAKAGRPDLNVEWCDGAVFRRFTIAIIGVICTFAFTSTAEDFLSERIDPLIASFVAEQEKSLAQLDSLDFQLQVHIYFENPEVTIEHVGTIRQKHAPGKLAVDVNRLTVERPITGQAREVDTSARYLANGDYAIYWLTASPSAEMWEYNAATGLPRPAALIQRIDMEGEYLRRFGFGALDFEFAQLLEPRYSEGYRYEVQARDDGKYQIQLYLHEGAGPEVSLSLIHI